MAYLGGAIWATELYRACMVVPLQGVIVPISICGVFIHSAKSAERRWEERIAHQKHVLFGGREVGVTQTPDSLKLLSLPLM